MHSVLLPCTWQLGVDGPETTGRLRQPRMHQRRLRLAEHVNPRGRVIQQDHTIRHLLLRARDLVCEHPGARLLRLLVHRRPRTRLHRERIGVAL